MSIIYGLIAQNNKPLCDYSEYKGTFTSICIRTLPKCSNERGLLTIQNAYNIFYRNENGITFLYLCENSFPQEAAIVCLDKTIEEFFKNFSTQTDYSNEPQYCLNNQFQRKLFEKMQKYNSNSNILDENINELKENLLSMNKQVIESSELVNERGDQIQLIVNKAEKLSQDSHNFADTTKRVKRLEKWRKIKMYIIIGGIILALILLIYIFSKI
jgi:hypothetical protein